MNKLKTTIFATALAGLAVPATALAQIDTKDLGASDSFVISLASETDRAPTRTGTDGIARLRMTDEEFTNEQASVRFSPDGRRALYVHMRTSVINEGTARESPPTDRMQCALSALETSVGIYSGLLVASLLPELRYACGLATVALIEGDPTRSPLVSLNGELEVRRPEPDPALLHRWRPDRDRSAEMLRKVRSAAQVLT